MSDTILLGVLRMPLDIWPTDKSIFELRKIQSRCVEAADRIEADEQKILELEDQVKQLKVALVRCAKICEEFSETFGDGTAFTDKAEQMAIRIRRGC